MGRESSQRPRLRPHFELELDLSCEVVLASLRRSIGERGAPVAGSVLLRQAELRIPRERAHFWSPHLSIELDHDAPGACRLHGRFGPDPSIWMMFMGVYGIEIALGIGGTMYGASQLIVGERAWALLAAPLALALVAFTYGAVFIGQGLGAEEMYTLRSFVDHAVERARSAAPAAPEGRADG